MLRYFRNKKTEVANIFIASAHVIKLCSLITLNFLGGKSY